MSVTKPCAQRCEGDARAVVREAIRLGYRHIDTAYLYHNEDNVGLGIADVINEGLVRREDLFVVSKLPSQGHRRERVLYFLKKSLASLQLDYLDLYLIHTPFHIEPEDGNDDEPKEPIPDSNTDYLQTWKGMEDCVRLGLTKSIGLSNFNSLQILDIYKNATIKPSNLQVECHPYLAQNELLAVCRELDITVTAYAPLGSPFLPDMMRNNGL
ncbi:AKR1A1 [Cordylochernes scorpioides]|uniref:AKR1A1 n=1 Tax=Cordylochernes scorpioides TaxID=51811 RepID=A0ABY6KXC3_9ARAC|nr:AKR1A1 [Cordylochernes scorpioides]